MLRIPATPTARIAALLTAALLAGPAQHGLVSAVAAAAKHPAGSGASRCKVTSKRKARNRHASQVRRGCRKRHPERRKEAVGTSEWFAVPPANSPASSPHPHQAVSTTPASTPSAPWQPVAEPANGLGLEPAPPFRFFSPGSVWNALVPTSATALDPHSPEVMASFFNEIDAEIASKNGPWIDTTAYSVPIYRVPADQATVHVDLTARSPSLQRAFEEVPLPPDAMPAAGSDSHLLLWQPATDRLWEFWRLSHGPGGWHAGWGGAMEDVANSSGVFGPTSWPGATRFWGASACSLSIAGGLITLEDLERGYIDHALAISVPNIRARVYAAPAERTDGISFSPRSLPEGAHLRLNPNLDVEALKVPPLVKMMARAAQRYGVVIRDGSPSVASFYAQDPTPTGTDPYHEAGGYFEGRYPTQLLAEFPWHQLQLLKMELSE